MWIMLGESMLSNKRYVIFGLGREYKKYKRLIDSLCVVAYVDNSLVGKKVSNGEPVIEVGRVLDYEFDEIMVTSTKYADEMIMQLVEMDASLEDKVILLRDFMDRKKILDFFENELEKNKRKLRPTRPIRYDSTYYIVASANAKSGGPELLHQLTFELNRLGHEAYIAYVNCGQQKADECIPMEYIQYVGDRVIKIEDLPDDETSIIIFPEIYCDLLGDFKKSFIYLWWLSVDFMFWNIAPESIGYIYSQVDMHLYQSYYAKEFLDELEIPSTRMLSLSDYINDLYIQQDDTRFASEKKDIVAYNPAKGRLFTQKIIRKMPETKFVAIQNMTNTEVFELLKKSKVYIDFGNHPGKDRIPREAAMLGCCIITGRRGAAGNDIDVCIPDKYKFDESKCDIADICEQIKECMDNYEDNISDFEEYRKKIRAEKSLFEEQVKEIFK